MLQIHIIALADCTPMVPVGFADMLRKTLALGDFIPGFPVRRDVRVSLVSGGKTRTVSAAGGLQLKCELTLADVKRSDLVIVPALDPDVLEHLERNRAVVPWLKKAWLGGADVASACTGAFLLAEAGLLDEKRATTHWAFAELFKKRYPRVHLQNEAIIVDQGRVLTAGGATSFLTQSLYLVERIFGAEAARAASQLFLVDVNKAPQSAYAAFGGQKEHGDAPVLEAQQLIEHEPAGAPGVEQLARAVAMSTRTFVRRFKQATGNVPRDYLQRVRVEAAKRALEATVRGVAEIANDVGYEDLATFRKVFIRWAGLTPSDYRARYGRRGAPTLLTFRGAAGAREPRSSRRGRGGEGERRAAP
ncbi:MAG: helix-turn-helix domain-containing protein [Archangiaceae bacterium]|nr:helix-turn-helix domain-containing protein [Archangiaceae bacterium]